MAYPPIIKAARAGDVDALLRELAAGASPETVDDETGQTVIHSAVTAGEMGADPKPTSVACVVELLKAGASPNAPDYNEWTPLHSASSIRNRSKRASTLPEPGATRILDVVEVLLEAGAEVNAYNNAGWAPIHYAAQCGHVRLVERFIRAGANVNNNTSLGVQLLAVSSKNSDYGCHRDAWPTMLRAGYSLSFLDNTDFGTPGYNLQKHAPNLNTYLRKVHAAGCFAAYEKAHLASLAKIFIPLFDGLPKEVVRVIVSFWAHAGYY